MIDECHNRGIEIVAVLPPKISAAGEYAASWETQKEYFDSRGVGYLNYNTYEQIQRIGLNLGTDYYNAGHLNVYGSIKFSRVLAQDLKENYKLVDHRGDERYKSEWEEVADFFNEIYQATP